MLVKHGMKPLVQLRAIECVLKVLDVLGNDVLVPAVGLRGLIGGALFGERGPELFNP